MLDEQVRAADDLQLQQLLTRIRQGVADQSDVDLLNHTCYEEGGADPMGNRDHSSDAAEQEPMESEHRGDNFVPETAPGTAEDLHLGAQMERRAADRGGGSYDFELWRRQQRAGTSHIHVCAGNASRHQPKHPPRPKAGQ
jgi:hypothetical protein